MSRIVPPSARFRRSSSRLLAGLLLAGLLLVIAWPVPADEPEESQAGAPATQAAVDLDARRAQIEAAERRFNGAARERDRQSFHDLLAKDSVFLAGELHRGRLEVMAIWQHLFDGKYDFRYQAETLEVTVARSGELGWSIGEVRTSFQRPGIATEQVTEGHYLHLWTLVEGSWQLSYSSSLVVHPSLGAARDPRGGLMTAWPELADQIGAEIEIRWSPDVLVRAESGELAYSFGRYEASFVPRDATSKQTETAVPATDAGETTITGKGHFLAVWQKDDRGHWQLAAEGFTPPGIYGAG